MSEDEIDVQVEVSDEEGAEGTLADKLKLLREKLKACEQQKASNLLGWQRSKADFVNLSRRAEVDRQTAWTLATEDLVLDLLPALDSLEAALVAAPKDETWAKGFTSVDSLIKKVLESHGVTVINEIGVLEDPRIHESIQTSPAANGQDAHTVTSVLQKGYKVGDKVIRAAKVVVSV